MSMRRLVRVCVLGFCFVGCPAALLFTGCEGSSGGDDDAGSDTNAVTVASNPTVRGTWRGRGGAEDCTLELRESGPLTDVQGNGALYYEVQGTLTWSDGAVQSVQIGRWYPNGEWGFFIYFIASAGRPDLQWFLNWNGHDSITGSAYIALPSVPIAATADYSVWLTRD